MQWHERIAKEMNIKHSDTLAVIRYGKKAKRATRRRNRRLSKKEFGPLWTPVSSI
jgi:hypothetical protein